MAVPFPDAKNWKRVRFWGVEHFTGFRYGDEHHAVAAAFLRDVPVGHRETSQSCMRRFEAWAQPKTRAYQFKLGEFQTHRAEWRKMPVVVRTVDGHVDFAFSRIHFSAAWAAYPAYPDACLVYAVAVPWDEHPELARAVRDRWVDEGFARTQPLTESRPFRKE